MSKIAIELESTQLEKALIQLEASERFRLAKVLAAQSFHDVIAKLRRTVHRKGLSAPAITRIIDQARQELAHRRRH